MKNRVIFKSLILATCLSAMLIAHGCGDTASDAADKTDATNTDAEETSDTDSNTDNTEDTSKDSNDISTTEASEEPAEEPADDEVDAGAIYQQYLDDALEYDGELFSAKYSFVKEDFDMVPSAYYYDVDEDGENELLISTFYYGFDIYDVRDGELVLLDHGDGTSDTCSVFYGEDHTYVSHSDFLHEGRQILVLIRYDENGDVVEMISLSATYEDSESGTYDEGSQFSYNENAITMLEYEEYLSLYQAVPVEDMEEAEIDESLFE